MNTNIDDDSAQRELKALYLKKGFLKDKQDVDDLHSAFSPYIIPTGLTKLQIRRKINKFIKSGRKLKDLYDDTHRVNIFVDGKFLSGTTYGRPISNHKEFVRFLKDFLKVLQSPKRKPPVGF